MTPDALTSGEAIVIVDDGRGLAEAVAGRLRARDVPSNVVSSGDEVPTDAVAVLHLGGARPFDAINDALEVNRDAFLTATRIAETCREEGGLFIVVQDTGGQFGFDEWCDALKGPLGGLAGLAKTAAKEWPLATVRALDLDVGHRQVDEVAAQLVEELFSGDGVVEVGLPEGERVEFALRPAEVEGQRDVVDADSVIVASGGAQGVTAECLIALARETQASFVLLGRTELEEEPESVEGVVDDAELKRALLQDAKDRGETPSPAELGARATRVRKVRAIRDVLARFEAAGSRVRYVSGDVRDVMTLSDALDEVREEWGPITGIVHGAGVLADKLLTDKTIDQFELVFGTKVSGYYALTAATSQDPISLICLFSSVAGRGGNPGQSDYAMANEVLNKLAQAEHRRRGEGCHVKSINWGPWESGMVTPELEAEFERRGVALIPVDVGSRIFVDEVQGGSPDEVEVVVGSVDIDAARDVPPVDEEAARPRELEFRHGVSVRSHPFLIDHAVDGTPVLPMVSVIDWFTRAASELFPSLVVDELKDIQVLRSAKLHHFTDGEDVFRVRAQRRSNGIAAAKLELAGPDDRPYYRATATMAPESRRENQEIEFSGEPWEGLVYDGEVLFHGPRFQVLESVEVNREGAAGVISTGRKLGWEEDWADAVDVPALDGALQLAVLWTKEHLEGVSLPMKLRGVRFFSPAGGTSATLRCRVASRAVDRTRAVSDIELTTEEGELVARLEGLETLVYRPM